MPNPHDVICVCELSILECKLVMRGMYEKGGAICHSTLR